MRQKLLKISISIFGKSCSRILFDFSYWSKTCIIKFTDGSQVNTQTCKQEYALARNVLSKFELLNGCTFWTLDNISGLTSFVVWLSR